MYLYYSIRFQEFPYQSEKIIIYLDKKIKADFLLRAQIPQYSAEI